MISYRAVTVWPEPSSPASLRSLAKSSSSSRRFSYPHAVFVWEIQNAVKSLGHWMPAIKEGKSIPSTVKMELTLEVKE
jgi:hypothetical protein